MTRLVLCALIFTAGPSTLRADDATKAELDKARAYHQELIDAAKTKFISAADAKLEEYASKGDLNSVKEIEVQVEAFKKQGSLPSSRMLREAKRKYEADIRAANAALQTALEKARVEFTKALQIAEATAVDAELKQLVSGRPARNSQTKEATDLLQKGTVWTGYQRYAVGNMVKYELRVESREGDKFTGAVKRNSNNFEWDAAGTVKDGKIEWKATKKRAGGSLAPINGFLKGDQIRFSFRGPKGNPGSGVLDLVEKTRMVTENLTDVDVRPSARTPQSEKMPDVAEFEAFLARYDRAWDSARQRLIQAIKNRKLDLEHSSLDGDEKIRRSAVIDKDLAAFSESNVLPNCDDLLDLVVNFLEYYQKNIEPLETTRARWSDKAARLNDETAIAKLKELERQLDTIIGGREQFVAGSKWSGKRQTPAGALQINLTVTDRAGVSFAGELRQSAGGRGVRMKVEGALDRNKISFHTTDMLRGANRTLGFNGYLLSDRIITSVEGITLKGKPASGWISLWRSEPGPGR
jgi:hypothetical protein